MKSISKVRNLSLLVVSIATLAGCGGDKKSDQAPHEATAMETLTSDIANLRSIPHDGFAMYDAMNGGKFSRIFGGTGPSEIANYLDTRLHHYFDPSDKSVHLSPEGIMGPDPFGGQDLGDGVVMGAANMGTAMWYLSQVYSTPVTFSYQGKNVPIDSSRAGVMMIGKGYNQLSAQTQDGGTIAIPPFYRQAILLHEARHSDCTGGLAASDIGDLRAGTKSFEGRPCGHTHVICPPGHDAYSGKPACDNESWGAYRVGEVFLRGIAQDSNLSWTDSQIARIMYMDNESRILVTETGLADMSSEGVK
jgi:hypothetical protein